MYPVHTCMVGSPTSCRPSPHPLSLLSLSDPPPLHSLPVPDTAGHVPKTRSRPQSRPRPSRTQHVEVRRHPTSYHPFADPSLVRGERLREVSSAHPSPSRGERRRRRRGGNRRRRGTPPPRDPGSEGRETLRGTDQWTGSTPRSRVTQ